MFCLNKDTQKLAPGYLTSVDKKDVFISKLGNSSVEYTTIVELKDSVYLLSGNTYTGNGIGETLFFTIEIKGHGIKPYNAFNKEAAAVYSISTVWNLQEIIND